jgi:hypothetical protein
MFASATLFTNSTKSDKSCWKHKDSSVPFIWTSLRLCVQFNFKLRKEKYLLVYPYVNASFFQSSHPCPH